MATRVSKKTDWQGMITRAQQNLSTSTATSERKGPLKLDAYAVAGSIDHTLLKLDATSAQIDRLCEEAKTYSFKVR